MSILFQRKFAGISSSLRHFVSLIFLRMVSISGGNNDFSQTSLPHKSMTVRNQVRKLGFLEQVWLLLWKSSLQRRRSLLGTLSELLSPLIGAIIVFSIRQTMEVKSVSFTTFYEPKVLGPHAAGNLTKSRSLMLYAPNTLLVNSLMREIDRMLLQDGLNATTKGFASESEAEDFFQLSAGKGERECPMSVIFNDVRSATTWPTQLTYKIRPQVARMESWSSERLFPVLQKIVPRYPSELYYKRGFLYTQRLIGEALIRQWTNNANATPVTISTNRMPFPPYIDDGMIEVAQVNFPIMFMLSFILSVIFASKNIVNEKEKQLKESMKLMGVSPTAYWTSWFVHYFLYMLVSAFIYTVFISINLSADAVLVYSDPTLVFAFIMVYSISVITFCFFISSVINKANVAAAFSGIAYYGLFFPYTLIKFEKLGLREKLFMSLMFNIAMSFGAKTIGLYEATGKGVQWNLFTEPPSVDDNFSLMHAMLMLILDSFIFVFLTWYIDNVFPGTYGIPRPWYFLFQESYWRNSVRSMSVEHSNAMHTKYFEPDPVNMPIGIRLVDLRKVYGETKVAVKGSTLNMYEGQITVLLGRNGAGKTSTMSMLTGFIPPTSGTAYVNGFDIRTDINSVRSSLGLCPQHNILFDNLTVDEHFIFFARIKGCEKNDVPSMVEEMAKEVGLSGKRKSLARTLSGGQKRRLCVGISLIGGSKVIILDEPTSAMDPAARRSTWELLKRHRAGRTILLSTHFMDEADFLGDRIAIMADGVIKCCGTPMFLKKCFGAGYHLVIVKLPGCDMDKLNQSIVKVVSTAQFNGEVGAELSYLLPADMLPQFPDLFNMLEKNCVELGIASFGATSTTMEEVFLRVSSTWYFEDYKKPEVQSNALFQSEFKSSNCSQIPRTSTAGDNDKQPMNSTQGLTPKTILDTGTTGDINNEPVNSTEELTPNTILHSGIDGDHNNECVNSKANLTPKSILHTGTTGDNNNEPVNFKEALAPNTILHTDTTGDNKNKPVNSKELETNALDTGSLIIEIPSIGGIVPEDKDLLSFNKDFVRLTGIKLNLSRFYGMFVKKAIHTSRNRLVSLVQLALPVIFTITAITVDKVGTDSEGIPLTLDLSGYEGTFSAYSTGQNSSPLSTALGQSYSTLFHGDDRVQQIDRSRHATMNDFYLAQEKEIGLFTYNKRVIIGADFEPDGANGTFSATAWFSGQPYHSEPVALAFLMNAFARQATGYDGHKITTILHPMRKIDPEAALDSLTDTLELGFSIGFSMLFGMTILTASFSLFLIREQKSGAKHLQVVSGVGPFEFWTAAFSWDMVNFCVPCFVLVAILYGFQVKAYTDGNLASILLVLMVFGLAVLPFTYLLHFPFKSPATGFVVIVIFSILSGMFPMMTVYILRLPYMEMADMGDSLDFFFMALFPHYALGMGFTSFYVNHRTKMSCKIYVPNLLMCPTFVYGHPCCADNCVKRCSRYFENYLAWLYPGTGRNVICMCLQALFYFSVLLAIEYKMPQRLLYYMRGERNRRTGDLLESVFTNLQGGHPSTVSSMNNQFSEEDNDVAGERKRVTEGETQNDVLVLKNLFKEHGSFVSVDHICVGVPEGECFGLLGQNGAGKSATFKMLTGEFMASGGDATVGGKSIKQDIKRVQANLGYCPQLDALIDQMTGRETLNMYARLRGIPPKHLSRVVTSLLSILMLDEPADRLTRFYSEGQKRELSTAIALIGDPAVILLDEPSTGLDPVARRQLWTVLSRIRKSGKTFVLTSHSMEESDALCTRIAIMVNGQFKCLGSPQHLKSKFGHGYTLTVKLAPLENGELASPQPFIDFIFDMFPGSMIFDDQQGYIHFQVPDLDTPLSQLFGTMEKAKKELNLEDYSVHQTTLEQIFLTFTKLQHPPRKIKRKLCGDFFRACLK